MTMEDTVWEEVLHSRRIGEVVYHPRLKLPHSSKRNRFSD